MFAKDSIQLNQKLNNSISFLFFLFFFFLSFSKRIRNRNDVRVGYRTGEIL